MGAINRSLEIDWAGKTHKLVITMGVINHVEQHLNAVAMLHRAINGDVRLSQAALLFSILLNEAGEKVTQEEIYLSLGSGKEVVTAVSGLCVRALTLMFPEVEEKKPKAPKAKRSTRTRGKTSTK